MTTSSNGKSLGLAACTAIVVSAFTGRVTRLSFTFCFAIVERVERINIIHWP